MILSEGTIDEKINDTAAKGYGPIFFVLKNDDRFCITRTADSEQIDKYDRSKLELFYTGFLGKDHYGIRTGFPSTDINYIITDFYDDRIGLEIAMNGFYIPVANREGKIIFTPKDYDELRSKMQGLSYYDKKEFHLSNNLETNEIINIANTLDNNDRDTSQKREKIVDSVRKSVSSLKLNLKEKISKDLEEGYVELIDTGSTGRGTNVPGDGDFDFMLKMDQKIMISPIELSKLKEEIKKGFKSIKEANTTSSGDFRFKGVSVEGLDEEVDIDITFETKTDKVNYSTDMCVRDQYPDKYNLVIANIIRAKELLKKNNVYKSFVSDETQGGLGGVGVENWILQNGGSLEDAARSFLLASEGKTFEEFKKSYHIYDFGENHMFERKHIYPHDEFVYKNMSEDGYNKMKTALNEYLMMINLQKNTTNTEQEEHSNYITEAIMNGENIETIEQEDSSNHRKLGFVKLWIIATLMTIITTVVLLLLMLK